MVFGLQATKLDELLKAPLLIEHFIQHEEMFPGISVYNFIKIHYLDKQTIDGDYAEDMKLPFKTVDCHFQSVQLFTPPVTFFGTSSGFPLIKEKFPHSPDVLPDPLRLSVFLPPRRSTLTVA